MNICYPQFCQYTLTECDVCKYFHYIYHNSVGYNPLTSTLIITCYYKGCSSAQRILFQKHKTFRFHQNVLSF